MLAEAKASATVTGKNDTAIDPPTIVGEASASPGRSASPGYTPNACGS
ncbi:hypothetical protein [Syntrophomonas zehnderi]|nr:hypothetical protein [Syntrophomonas zehnderi]